MGIMESLGYVDKSRLDEALERGEALEKELEELRGKVSVLEAEKSELEELREKVSVLEAEKSELEKKHKEALKKSRELESQLSKLSEEPEVEEEES